MSNNCETQTKSEIDEQNQKKIQESICYHIKAETPFIKCNRFYLMKDDKILYMAKLKYDNIYIGDGDNFHIGRKNKKGKNHIERDLRGFNVVKSDDQEFKIKYSKNGERFPLKATFLNNGKKIRWMTKDAEYREFCKSENDHKPRNSKRNIILMNHQNQTTFIMRKWSKKHYEVESIQDINPFIIFSIAISEIVGPIYI